MERFLIGFCKKVLLANTFAEVADITFDAAWMGQSVGVDFAWLGALSYAFQIFFDFSVYSDMAIGLGKMFGFHFNENFNYPYFADSVSDFWRRWHISLGSVLGGWIIFRAATLGTILRYVKNMLGLGAGGWHDDRLNLYLSENAVFYVVALLLSVPLFSMLEHKIKKNAKAENVWGIAKPVLLLLIFLISISYLVINSYNPFIYFNF